MYSKDGKNKYQELETSPIMLKKNEKQKKKSIKVEFPGELAF